MIAALGGFGDREARKEMEEEEQGLMGRGRRRR